MKKNITFSLILLGVFLLGWCAFSGINKVFATLQPAVSTTSVVTQFDKDTIQVVETKRIPKATYVGDLQSQINIENKQILTLQNKIADQRALIDAVK